MKVFIGVDPHKLSVTIEVVDDWETALATGRFNTDKAGYGRDVRGRVLRRGRVGSPRAGRYHLEEVARKTGRPAGRQSATVGSIDTARTREENR
jgi:hypothetical protein